MLAKALNGNVHTYSNKYWYSKNPHSSLSSSAWPWSQVLAHTISELMFFKGTINPYHYVWLILTKLLKRLPEERMHGYFMQETSTAHTANSSATERHLANSSTNKLWPGSLNLNPLFLFTKNIQKTSFCTQSTFYANTSRKYSKRKLLFQDKSSCHIKYSQTPIKCHSAPLGVCEQKFTTILIQETPDTEPILLATIHRWLWW